MMVPSQDFFHPSNMMAFLCDIYDVNEWKVYTYTDMLHIPDRK